MRVTFTGDIMVEQPQLEAIGRDFNVMFAPISQCFRKTDILVGNLETPVAGEDAGFTNHKWSFNSPDTLLDALKSVGFSILSTANNHCLDRGCEGAIMTIEKAHERGIKTIGTYSSEATPHYIIEDINGQKIAFLSFTYGTNSGFNGHILPEGQAWMVDLLSTQEKPFPKPGRFDRYNLPLRIYKKLKLLVKGRKKDMPTILFENIKSAIEETRSLGAEKIFFLSHMGGQYQETPSTYSKEVVRFLLDNGVDYVIGNHEHTIHESMFMGNKFVAYCLGNFAMSPNSESTDKETLNKAMADISILLHFDFDEESLTPTISFQIVKNILGPDGISRIYLLHDLIEDEKNLEEKEKLVKEYSMAASKFSGQVITKNIFEHNIR